MFNQRRLAGLILLLLLGLAACGVTHEGRLGVARRSTQPRAQVGHSRGTVQFRQRSVGPLSPSIPPVQRSTPMRSTVAERSKVSSHLDSHITGSPMRPGTMARYRSSGSFTGSSGQFSRRVAAPPQMSLYWSESPTRLSMFGQTTSTSAGLAFSNSRAGSDWDELDLTIPDPDGGNITTPLFLASALPICRPGSAPVGRTTTTDGRYRVSQECVSNSAGLRWTIQVDVEPSGMGSQSWLTTARLALTFSADAWPTSKQITAQVSVHGHDGNLQASVGLSRL